MKTPKLVSACIAIAMTAVIYTGCKKEDSVQPEASSSQSEKYGTFIGDASMNDAFTLINGGNSTDRVIQGQTAIAVPSELSSCAKITMNTTRLPYNITYDFGNGCLGSDGNFRTGVVVIAFTGEYRNPGTVFTIMYNNYTLNHNLVAGEIIMTNRGVNAEKHIEFKVLAKESVTVQASMLAVDPVDRITGTKTMSYEANLTMEWIIGDKTNDWNDDVYLIRGGASGVTLSNAYYTTDIKVPLRMEVGFPYYTSGVLNMTISRILHAVNYGYFNNLRDNLATITTNDKVEIIHLDRNPLMIVNVK